MSSMNCVNPVCSIYTIVCKYAAFLVVWRACQSCVGHKP